jgi:hypothetical protein
MLFDARQSNLAPPVPLLPADIRVCAPSLCIPLDRDFLMLIERPFESRRCLFGVNVLACQMVEYMSYTVDPAPLIAPSVTSRLVAASSREEDIIRSRTFRVVMIRYDAMLFFSLENANATAENQPMPATVEPHSTHRLQGDRRVLGSWVLAVPSRAANEVSCSTLVEYGQASASLNSRLRGMESLPSPPMQPRADAEAGPVAESVQTMLAGTLARRFAALLSREGTPVLVSVSVGLTDATPTMAGSNEQACLEVLNPVVAGEAFRAMRSLWSPRPSEAQ